MRTFAGASLVLFSLTLAGAADAGAISAVGAVKALDHVDQLRGVVGRADFDEGPTAGPVPRRVYADRGLSWQSGPLGAILPGCTSGGTAYPPDYGTFAYFPAPIAGGAAHSGQSSMYGGVATFSVPVTQVGLTASTNGTQYLTAWA